MKIGIIGLGKMGEALCSGLQARNASEFTLAGTTRSQESSKEASNRLKIPVHTDNSKLARDAEILVLCVKPHQAKSVIKELARHLTSQHLLISVCASITHDQLEEWTGGKPALIRAMPNTPCLVGEGMTVLSRGPNAERAQLQIAEKIFSAVGRVTEVEESLMDGVTGLSGCGPAYIYLIIEALSEAGVKVGLPRKTATLLAAQTLLGSAKMALETNEHPAALKDEVTTPAGCTIDGLMALEEGKLRVTLIKAVLAAAKRSQKLREK